MISKVFCVTSVWKGNLPFQNSSTETIVSLNHTCISCIFNLYSIVVMTDTKYKLTIRCNTTQRTIRRRPGGRQLSYSHTFWLLLPASLQDRAGINHYQWQQCWYIAASRPEAADCIKQLILANQGRSQRGNSCAYHISGQSCWGSGGLQKHPPPAERSQHTSPTASCIMAKRRKMLKFCPGLFQASPGDNPGLF